MTPPRSFDTDTDDPLYEAGSRLLTPDAFGFVLDTELRRAVRSRNPLTLVVMEASSGSHEIEAPLDDGTMRAVGAVVSRAIRETDLVGHTAVGTLSLLLLDTDFEATSRVVNRVLSRIKEQALAGPLRIVVGAACYPTHAVDAAALNQQAKARPIASWAAPT